tara:strand:+ start:299 stop:928 length:630 start_codon:yes stop_codon:yes gene_type:complete
MVEAKTVQEFLESMQKRYSEDRVVMLLFARYGVSNVNELLDSSFDYLDQNSGTDVDIFMPGYGKYKFQEADRGEHETLIELANNRRGWSFDTKKFKAFKDTVEKASDWKYNDHMELLIFNFKYNKISFDKYISIDLEIAQKKGYINSTRELFEKVIRLSRNGTSNVAKMSNGLGKEYGKQAFKDFIISKVPYGIGEAGMKISPFAANQK